MNAKDAHKRALEITQGKSADQLDKAYKAITSAASKGELRTTFYEKLLPQVKTQLESDGYKISSKDEFERNESYTVTTINW